MFSEAWQMSLPCCDNVVKMFYCIVNDVASVIYNQFIFLHITSCKTMLRDVIMNIVKMTALYSDLIWSIGIYNINRI